MARQDLGSLNLANALRPQAQQVNSYFRPNLSGPELQTITDLSPLSESLQGYLRQQAEERKDKQIAAGETWAVNNPELVRQMQDEAARFKDPEERRKALQGSFAHLVADGTIPESASPFFQIGFARASAKAVVGEYRSRLMAQLESVAQVSSEDDALPVAPENIDELIASTWEEMSGNVALQNFYGQQAATGLKQNVDLEFRQRAADARGQEMSRYFRDNLRNEAAQMFDTMALQDELTPESLEQMQEFVDTEMHEHSIREPRQLVFEGLQLAVARAREVPETGTDDALRLLDHAGNLKVGTARLEDDAKVGLEIAKLKRDVLIQQERDEAAAPQKRANAIRQALQDAEIDYTQPLLEAFDTGDSIHGAYVRIRDEIASSGQYGEFTGLVLDQLLQYKQNLENTDRSQADVLDALEFALADGEDIGAELRAAQELGQITGRDYASFAQRNRARQSLVADVEANPVFQSHLGRLNAQASNVTGLAPDAQARYDEFTGELTNDWKDGYVALVESTQGDPEAPKILREYLTRETRAVREKIRTREQELLNGRAQFDAEFSELVARRQDGHALIEQAVQAGTLTEAEAARKRREGERAADRTPLFQRNDYREMLAKVMSAPEALEGLTDSQRIDAAEALRSDFEARLGRWMDDNLATTEPRDFDRVFRAGLKDIRDEVLAELAPAEVQDEVREGEAAGTAVARFEERTSNVSQAVRLDEAASRGAVSLDNFAPDGFQFQPSPHVPRALYDRMERFVLDQPSLTERVFTRRSRLVGLQDNFGQALRDVPDAERKQAALSFVSVTGVDPAWLTSGTMVFQPPPERQEKIQRTLDRFARQAQSSSRQVRRNAVAAMENLIQRERYHIEVPLEASDINPYVTPLFSSIDQMREWKQDRPADWNALMQKLDIEPDSTEERELMKFQASAISRISTD